MLLLLLEALAALGLLIFIVWWVMFAGRRKGERDDGRRALIHSRALGHRKLGRRWRSRFDKAARDALLVGRRARRAPAPPA